MNIMDQLKNNLINIPGWRTNRKIVIINSDDWDIGSSGLENSVRRINE